MSDSNAVFISYRREVGAVPALALFQQLTDLGIDAFLDVQNIRAGRFGEIILQQIERRPYFALILTPKTLDRCSSQGDWVRRELEHAVETNRTIVPICTSLFSLDDMRRHLTPHLATALRRFNIFQIRDQLTSAEVARLADEFLRPIDLPFTHASPESLATADKVLMAVRNLPPVTATALAAQSKFEEGLVLSLADQFDAAIAAYTTAIGLNPRFADAFHSRGVEFSALGRHQEAIDDFSRAIELMPTMDTAWHNRGVSQLALRNWDNAVADFSETLRLHPGYIRALKNRSRAYEGQKEFDKARADIDEAIDLRPEHDDLYKECLYLRALQRMRGEDKHGALDDLDRAIMIDPSFALAFFWRGALRKDLGDTDGAIADWLRSRELDPDSPLQMVSYESNNRRRRWFRR